MRTFLRVQLVGRERPAIATPQVMASTTGSLYVVGGVMVMLSLAVTGSRPATLAAIAILAVVAVTTGLVTLHWGSHFPVWTYDLLVLSGSLIISTLVCLGGGGATSLGYAALYTFVAIDCFFFFAWPKAVLHLVVFQTCSFAALSYVGLPVSAIFVPQGCAAVVALAVGWLVRAVAAAANAAEKDPLTSLTNRRGLDRHLEDIFGSPVDDLAPLSLVMLDLDHFKTVNDTFGHEHGDRVLGEVTRIWASMLRPGQVLARLGGDEFALLLPGCAAERAVSMADDLRASVAGQITCSAGVAQRQEGDSRSILFSRADVALYEAKARGRDQTAWQAVDNRTGAVAIRAAIDAGEFEVYYQPVVSLDSLVVTGHEALIRWNHPERGLIAPTDFIPAAEQSGAIHALGAWVVEQACAKSVALAASSGRPHRMSVNASGIELRTSGYAEMVVEIIERLGMDPTSLVLEVTESTLDGDHCDVLAALHQLRRSRIKIAIDDFGTGYSTLNRLDKLPVDILKIDRSFVIRIDEGSSETHILAAIVTLAQAMGLQTVAEGIETPRQANVLNRLGCTSGQGYLFGRPNPDPDSSWLGELASA